MNNNLEVIYKIIKPGMNKFVAQPILGVNIALGIERYCTLQDELIGGDVVDYAELVVEALDKDLLTNDIFISSLILDLINENDVKGLAVLLKIPADLSAFKKRQSILGCGKNVVKKTLLTFYNLEKDYFVNPTPLKNITT